MAIRFSKVKKGHYTTRVHDVTIDVFKRDDGVWEASANGRRDYSKRRDDAVYHLLRILEREGPLNSGVMAKGPFDPL